MKSTLAFLLLLCTALSAHAQTSITLPISAAAVADIGNGPIKVRVIQGNASIFTAQGSGTGSTSGSSTTLTLTSTPATAPIVGGLISGGGITPGTTVAAYNGITTITLSAAMTVPSGTALSWGAACPSSAAGIPSQYIQASVMADYYLLYTQARVCAVSPGGPVNTLLILPLFYDQTSPFSVQSVFGRTGVVTAQTGDYSVGQVTGAAPLASPTFTGTPAAPTPGSNISTTQIPTTAWVNNWFLPLAGGTISGRIIDTYTPVYDLAAGVAALGIYMPLNSATHTVADGKEFDHFRLSQSDGSDNIFTIGKAVGGAGGIVNGFSAFLQSSASSDVLSNLYAGGFAVTNAGPGNAKAVHATGSGSGTSTGVIFGVTAEAVPVATTSTGSGALQVSMVGGANDRASYITPSNDGSTRVLYGYGTVVAAQPYKNAVFQAWMSSASDAAARAFTVWNDAGTELAYWSQAGKLFAPLGSAAAPSYSFNGDTDTGVFSRGANIISFATNGTQRGEINASGALSWGSATGAVFGFGEQFALNGFGVFGTITTGPALAIGDSGSGSAVINGVFSQAVEFRQNNTARMWLNAGLNVGATSSDPGAGNLKASGFIQAGSVAVGSLPSCAAGTQGARLMVTDANATTFWSIVASGGANIVPVTCDGTNWRIG